MHNFPVMLAALGLGQPVPAPSNLLPSHVHLVWATTIHVRPVGGSKLRNGRIRVTKAVAGPAYLVGEEFDVWYGDSIRMGSRCDHVVIEDVVGHLEEGAEGLWWVQEDYHGRGVRLLPHAPAEQYRVHRFPYQRFRSPPPGDFGPGRHERAKKRQEKDWADAQVWARVVGEVYATDTDAVRWTLLEKAAAADSPPAAWAVAMIGLGQSTHLLRRLAADPRLVPEAQVTLDRELCRLDRHHWPTDDVRRRLLSRWLDPAAPSDLFAAGCSRLSQAAADKQLSAALLADVAGPALAAGDRVPDTSHLNLALGGDYRQSDRAGGFALLAGVLRDATSSAVRGDAAARLAGYAPLTAAERAVVRPLRAAEADPGIAAVLDGLLDRR